MNVAAGDAAAAAAAEDVSGAPGCDILVSSLARPSLRALIAGKERLNLTWPEREGSISEARRDRGKRVEGGSGKKTGRGSFAYSGSSSHALHSPRLCLSLPVARCTSFIGLT